jgi:hypothetical protein
MGFDASLYSGSNYFTGEYLKNKRIEFGVLGVRGEEFEDGKKPVIVTDFQGMKLVLNKTRCKAAIRAWGVNTDAWLDKRAVVSSVPTNYGGEVVASVGFEPISVTKITAPERRSAIEPPAPPPVTAEYDDNRDMVLEGVVDDYDER